MGKRIRTIDNTVSLTGEPTFDYYWANTCGTAPYWRNNFKQAAISQSSGVKAVMVDYPSKNFFERSRKGEIIINPMLRVSIDLSGSGAIEPVSESTILSCTGSALPYYKRDRRSIPNISGGLYISGWKFPDVAEMPVYSSILDGQSFRNLLTEVSTSVLNKRGRPQNGSNLWESVAEAHKLVGLLPGLLANATTLVRKHSKASSKAGAGASGWLALRYGLMPIISDIKGIVEGVSKLTGNVRETSRAFGSLSASQTTTVTGNKWMLYMGSANLGYDFTVNELETLEVRAMSIDALEASLLYNVGFSTKGLVTLPWELVNKSFVADWFLNIGDFLGALVPAFGFHNLGSCYVLRGTRTSTLNVTNCYGLGSNIVVTPVSGSASRIWTYTKRVPGLEKPGIVIKNDFRFENAIRALDAISILTNELRKFK